MAYTDYDSRNFVDKNLGVLAAEICEWKETGILKEGKLRQLASMVSDWAGHNYKLEIAENLTVIAALKAVSKSE